MLITNDVALVVLVPLTLSLRIQNKGVLVILEALAANAGSALTPTGNPQNLFIYWHYGLTPEIFIRTIAPFSLVFLLILIIASLLVKTDAQIQNAPVEKFRSKAYIYGLLLFTVILTVFHVLPVYSGLVVILFAIIFDRQALRVDYGLLLSFLFFFGVADNLKIILEQSINHSEHIFLISALASQVISNVPATLVFAKLTPDWPALLWGANAGGFGSLFGSLANLIAYRIYITHEGREQVVKFTLQFIALGYIALLISFGLYFILYKTLLPL